MDDEIEIEIDALQARVTAVLTVPEGDPIGPFSDYMPSPDEEFRQQLASSAVAGGTAGMKAALDTVDRLFATEDHSVVRRALMLFLTHDDVPRKLGIRAPSYLQRRGAQLRSRQTKSGT